MPGSRERGAAEFVQLDPSVLRRRKCRRRVRLASTAGWPGCIQYLGRVMQDTTAQAQTEGLAEVYPDPLVTIRGGVHAQRASFALLERWIRRCVPVAPSRAKRGIGISPTACRAWRATTALWRT